MKSAFPFALLFLALAPLARADDITVRGFAQARGEDEAKAECRIDAAKQCLERTGHAGVERASDFTLEEYRPYDTGLTFTQAQADYRCTGQPG
jgi:hypothetical protein